MYYSSSKRVIKIFSQKVTLITVIIVIIVYDVWFSTLDVRDGSDIQLVGYPAAGFTASLKSRISGQNRVFNGIPSPIPSGYHPSKIICVNFLWLSVLTTKCTVLGIIQAWLSNLYSKFPDPYPDPASVSEKKIIESEFNCMNSDLTYFFVNRLNILIVHDGKGCYICRIPLALPSLRDSLVFLSNKSWLSDRSLYFLFCQLPRFCGLFLLVFFLFWSRKRSTFVYKERQTYIL